jgi:hypothetical protein
MEGWKEYNDAYSRAVFQKFKEALEPTLARVAPYWLLHHIEMMRRTEFDAMDERVEIRLVIKPIRKTRFRNSDADLLTSHKCRTGPNVK